MNTEQLITVKEETTFDKVTLSTETNRVRNANSVGVHVPYQNVAISVTIENAKETSSWSFEVYAEGSYNRKIWTRESIQSLSISVSGTPNVPLQQATAQLAVDYPYLRLRSIVAGGSVRFSAQLVFSDQ